MGSIKLKKLIIYSSRSGGPYRQHHLLYKYLHRDGFCVEHWSGLVSWIKLHFMYGKNVCILTNVPLIFRFQKKNFFLNIHGNYKKERNLLTNPLGYLYDLNIKLAEKVVVPNVYLKNILKIEDAFVIPNSVEGLEKINILNKNDTNMTRLVCVTHFAFLNKSKGVLEIIKSIRNLRTSEKVVLDIFGTGRFLEEIKKESGKILVPKNVKVVFRGFSKNIAQELINSDIFVYWSSMDIMPTSLIEAMSCGLPIVVNNFPPFMEMIGKKNILSNSQKEFRLGIEKMIKSKRYREEIGRDNLITSKKYLIDNNLERWINFIYEK